MPRQINYVAHHLIRLVRVWLRIQSCFLWGTSWRIQPTHSIFTPYAHIRVHVRTHAKKKIWRLSSFQCAGYTQYHQMHTHVYPAFSKKNPEKRCDTRVSTLVGNMPLNCPATRPHVLSWLWMESWSAKSLFLVQLLGTPKQRVDTSCSNSAGHRGHTGILENYKDSWKS